MAFLESRREGEVLGLRLSGEWNATSLPTILAEQAALDLAGVRRARIATRGASRLDLAGSWALDDLTRRLAAGEVQVEFPEGEPRSLQLVRHALYADPESRPPALREHHDYDPVEKLGRTTMERVEE